VDGRAPAVAQAQPKVDGQAIEVSHENLDEHVMSAIPMSALSKE
jgi:hypothetical protein